MWLPNERGEFELDLRAGNVWAIAYVRRLEGTDIEVWSSIVTVAGAVTSQVHERLPDDQDGDVLARTKRHCEDVIKSRITEVVEQWAQIATMIASPDELDEITRRVDALEEVMGDDLSDLRHTLSARRSQT